MKNQFCDQIRVMHALVVGYRINGHVSMRFACQQINGESIVYLYNCIISNIIPLQLVSIDPELELTHT